MKQNRQSRNKHVYLEQIDLTKTRYILEQGQPFEQLVLRKGGTTSMGLTDKAANIQT